MRNTLFFCSLLLVSIWMLPAALNAQQGSWSIQNSGVTNSLTCVYFTDSQTGWAVGDSGTILKTMDGGATWTAQNSGTTNYLSSVYFVDSQTGWAVGEFGTILNTTNSGTIWHTQSSGTTNHLSSVYFSDHQIGWVAGESGTILKTVDGGATWNTMNSGTNWNLYSVHFIDSHTGWVGGGGYAGLIRRFGVPKILKTTDGGATWTSMPISGCFLIVYSIYFIDSQTGWAVGEDYSTPFGLEFQIPTIARTSDGGSTWTIPYSSGSGKLLSVHFTDNQTGWAVGTDGIIHKSTTKISTEVLLIWSFLNNIGRTTIDTSDFAIRPSFFKEQFGGFCLICQVRNEFLHLHTTSFL